MSFPHTLLALVATALLAGCPPARQPLPSGLPPEYEAPRSYDPGKNIDSAGAEEEDELVDAPPPATPTSEAPPPPDSPPTAE